MRAPIIPDIPPSQQDRKNKIYKEYNGNNAMEKETLWVEENIETRMG